MTERRVQKLLKISYFSILLLLLAVIVLSYLLSHVKTISERRICTTKACIKAANMIIDNLDPEVNPCDNFYEFACGNFIKTKRIPDEQSRMDVFDYLRDILAYKIADILAEKVDNNEIESSQKAKDLYKSCMDEEGIQRLGESRLLNFLKNELYGWPILTETFNFNSVSLLEKLTKLRLYDVRGFFDLYISTNPKDPSALILRIKQPSWFFNKEMYTNTSVITAYKAFMLKTAELLHSASKNLKQEIDRMYELEKEFALIQVDENHRRNAVYKNYTIKDLQKKMPEFDWKRYIFGLFNYVENVTITENEIILVDDMEYLEKAMKIYTRTIKTSRRDFDNLMLWTFVKDKTLFMSKKFKESRVDFDKVITGIVSIPARSLICSNFVLETMEYAVGRMYVSHHFNNQSKAAATEMILNIKDEFRILLIESDWMDSQSKKEALEKLELIDTKIGYPEFTYNDTYMDEIYSDYSFTNYDFLENYLNILKADTLHTLKEFRKKRERKVWQRGPAMINAFYSPPYNQICFPAGILQSPFYDATAPNYLNYGGIGSVIGHEITHGFDDRGRLYDKNGIYHPDDAEGIWTQKTIENYKKKVQCIIDQYNNYTSKQVNRTLNGFRTQGENIADNGGIKQAFRAYQKWAAKNGPEAYLPGLDYNQNQLFFINFGQIWCGKFRNQSLISRILNGEHSPGEFRVIGSTSNFEEFSKAFSCKPGQKNNPQNKCSVW